MLPVNTTPPQVTFASFGAGLVSVICPSCVVVLPSEVAIKSVISGRSSVLLMLLSGGSQEPSGARHLSSESKDQGA